MHADRQAVVNNVMLTQEVDTHDADADAMEQLLQQMQHLKEHGAEMPRESRLDQAERLMNQLLSFGQQF